MKSYNFLCRLHLISFPAPSLSILILASVSKPEAFLIERLQGIYLWSTQCSVDGGERRAACPDQQSGGSYLVLPIQTFSGSSGVSLTP